MWITAWNFLGGKSCNPVSQVEHNLQGTLKVAFPPDTPNMTRALLGGPLIRENMIYFCYHQILHLTVKNQIFFPSVPQMDSRTENFDGLWFGQERLAGQ